VNLLATFGTGSTLNEKDLETVRKVPGVGVAVPLSVVTGVPRVGDAEFSNGFVLGTTEGMPQILNQEIEYGSFFDEFESGRDVAVIGKRIAEQLFEENVPIGKSLQIGDRSFIVLGIFEEFDSSPLTPNTDYNSAVFIPYEIAKRMSGDHIQIQQVLAKPDAGHDTQATVVSIDAALKKLHGGQSDYTILKQEDNLAIASQVLNLLTGLISGIAAISLLVGGIGIMNIMLVAVSERTHEIGVRKAIGATNRQILGLFVIEAAVISFIGSIIGVILSLLANFSMRIFTDLQPVITWPIVGIAVIVGLTVGIFFGVAPAMKAARKDPIEALRQI
jgi:ABC-type antimicrobial peptide transport system permease subunit